MSKREVVVAILAKDKAMYLPLYLACLESQSWPKEKTHLYVRSNDNSDDSIAIIQRWLARTREQYASVHEDYSDLDRTLRDYAEHEWNAHRFRVLGAIRKESVEYARKLGCHYMVVDCDNFIQPDVVKTLVELVESGFPVAAPLLVTAADRYANLHVQTDENGYFLEGPYYEPIRGRTLTGVLKVDVVHCTYMIGWDAQAKVSYADGSDRYEYIVFSDVLRKAGVAQYIDNRRDHGRLSQCNSAPEFCRELRRWARDFECWKEGEAGRYLRALFDRHEGEQTATYDTPFGSFTVFRSEEFIAAPMKQGQAWEQGLIETLLPTLSSSEDVLDVGAHVGTHSVPYAKRARHVHAFEPQLPIHALLLQNLSMNRCTNVTAHAAALGHQPLSVCMSSYAADGASAGASNGYGNAAAAVNHGGIQIDAEGAPAEMRAIDDLGFDSLRYIKVDVEGAEPLVFWGARRTIRTHRPLILYERNHQRLRADVLDRLQVPEHVRHFRIELLALTLGYHEPVELAGQNFLLLPKRSQALAEKLVNEAWSCAAFFADAGGRIWCKMPERGDFPVGVLDDHTLCVWFHDVACLFTGTVTSERIAWNNGTEWQTA